MKKLLWAFNSRKVQVAVATIVVAIATQYGLQLDETVVYTVLGTGIALILGIAHEDAGKKLGNAVVENG